VGGRGERQHDEESEDGGDRTDDRPEAARSWTAIDE
jgi:hypothetical protein